MIESVSRRSFLKILTATMATPVIATAALNPTGYLTPGVRRVREFMATDLERDARFANAIFTPGNFEGACSLIKTSVVRCLPPQVNYEVRAVPLPKAMMQRYVGYRRNGYAVLWVVDRGMQRPHFLREPAALERVLTRTDEYPLIGRGVTGGILLRAPTEPPSDPAAWDHILEQIREERRAHERAIEAYEKNRIREVYISPSGRRVRVGLNGENLSGVVKRG